MEQNNFLTKKVGRKGKQFSKGPKKFNFTSDKAFTDFALTRLANFMNPLSRQLTVTKEDITDAQHKLNSRPFRRY